MASTKGSANNLIESINQLDLPTVTTSDIRWQYGTFRPFSSGSGRDKKHWARSGVQTSVGDIKESVWYEVAAYIAERDSEVWLVDALTEWERDHNYLGLKRDELRREALHHYASRIFDNPRWVVYIPFNRKYRPKVLEAARLVTVINACCGLTGETTQEQIDEAYQGQVYCLHCGRWGEFTVVGEIPAIPPWEMYEEI